MATGRYDQQQPAMLLVIDKFSTNNQLYNKVQKFAARITLKADKVPIWRSKPLQI